MPPAAPPPLSPAAVEDLVARLNEAHARHRRGLTPAECAEFYARDVGTLLEAVALAGQYTAQARTQANAYAAMIETLTAQLAALTGAPPPRPPAPAAPPPDNVIAFPRRS